MGETKGGETKKELTPKKEVIPKVTKPRKKVKIITRKADGGAEFKDEAVPVWMSSGMVGAAIAGGAWWAQAQGIGVAVNEETITTGMLQAIEFGGILLAAVGRFKATNKLKLY